MAINFKILKYIKIIFKVPKQYILNVQEITTQKNLADKPNSYIRLCKHNFIDTHTPHKLSYFYEMTHN